MPQALFHSSNSLHAGASTTRFSTPRPWATRCHLPQRMKRAKKLVKELPNSVARIGADAPSSVHRRRRALVFSDARWPRCSPRTESPVLAHLRPHCCTPSLRSLKSVVRRCNTRCSRGGRAPLQMRACPDFGATRIPHPCAESELAASRNRAPRAPPHPAPPRAAGNGAPPVHLMRLGKSHAS